MKNIFQKILDIFKINPEREVEALEILIVIYNSDYTLIEEALKNPYSSKDSILKAKDSLLNLRRKILYYLNKLVDDKILFVTRVEGKGKKFYSLNPDGNFSKINENILIETPSIPALPIGYLEDVGFAIKVENRHFFDRVNSVLLFFDSFESLDSFYDYVYSLFGDVNDVIGIYGFEKLLALNGNKKIIHFFNKLQKEAKTYDRRICFILDFTYLNDLKLSKFIDFFTRFCEFDYTCINFVFDLDGRELKLYSEYIEFLIKIFSLNYKKLNLKNDGLFKAPYLVGKAGPYCLSVKEWNTSLPKKGFVCVQSSIVLDLKAIFKNKLAKDVSNAVEACSRSLLYSNAYQRKFLTSIFKKLGHDSHDFNLSKNTIRFWNYEVYDNSWDNILFLDILKEIRDEIKLFCNTEKTIYLSCGMPTHFDINFSIAYRRLREKYLTKDFEEIQIKSIKDFSSETVRGRLDFFEKCFNLFDGGTEVRFKRFYNLNSSDVSKEINLLFSSFNLPFFCYHFSEIGRDMNLNSYINNGD